MLRRLCDPWLAQKTAIVLLLIGLALFVLEIRFEHQVVLGNKWQAWIPLIYSSGMVCLGALSLIFWQRWGRQAMVIGLLSGTIVGSLGFWFHSKGNPGKAIGTVIRVVSSTPGKVLTGVEGPPLLAPLALMGLTMLGAVVCAPMLVNGCRGQTHD